MGECDLNIVEPKLSFLNSPMVSSFVGMNHEDVAKPQQINPRFEVPLFPGLALQF